MATNDGDDARARTQADAPPADLKQLRELLLAELIGERRDSSRERDIG
jgi:hypothetical protein